MDEETQRIYDADIKRQHDTYALKAETPRSPYGNLTSALTPPVVPVVGRIAQLSKQVAEASQSLEIARARFSEARGHREHAEGLFAKVVEELLQAINEHREGTPENGANR